MNYLYVFIDISGNYDFSPTGTGLCFRTCKIYVKIVTAIAFSCENLWCFLMGCLMEAFDGLFDG